MSIKNMVLVPECDVCKCVSSIGIQINIDRQDLECLASYEVRLNHRNFLEGKLEVLLSLGLIEVDDYRQYCDLIQEVYS